MTEQPSATDLQPENTTVTEYAIRRRHHITGEWTKPQPWGGTLEQVAADAAEWAPEVEAHVVSREITTTPWQMIEPAESEHRLGDLCGLRELTHALAEDHPNASEGWAFPKPEDKSLRGRCACPDCEEDDAEDTQ